ncbi:MAG: hypothetical protein PHH06_03455 [Candidatus Gracilibacteria bacterium]|nr:hypothetical protein [Candidatus Gracilibacteria bacterium]
MATSVDVFSCKFYEPLVIADFALEFFKGEYYKIMVNMRDVK